MVRELQVVRERQVVRELQVVRERSGGRVLLQERVLGPHLDSSDASCARRQPLPSGAAPGPAGLISLHPHLLTCKLEPWPRSLPPPPCTHDPASTRDPRFHP